MPVIAPLRALLRARIDARALAVTRVGVGLAAVLRGIVGWQILTGVYAPGRCQMPVFEWLPAPSPTGIQLLGMAWIAAGAAMVLGLFTRAAVCVLAVVIPYVLALDHMLYESNLYLLLLLSILVAAGRSDAVWSVASVFGAAPQPPSTPLTVPTWPVTLLKSQLSIVYGFSALAKLTPTYLSGAVLSINLRRGGLGTIPDAWHTVGMMSLLAVASILVEVLLAVGFWSPRLRLVTAVAGVGFHGGILLLMVPGVLGSLAVFALEMFAIYPLFFIRATPAGRLGNHGESGLGSV